MNKGDKNKNFQDAGKVDHKKVKIFFEKKGYKVLEIHQIWRHIHGKLEKNNKIFFFKLSTTKDIGERTYNEVIWNKYLLKILKEKKIDFLTVPKIFKTGKMGDNFYYISEYFSGKQLGTKYPFDLSELEKWLEKIAMVNIFLLKIKKINLPRDKGRTPIIKRWEEYFKGIRYWYDTVGDKTLEPVLEKVKDIKTSYHHGLSHADFAPWHMIADGDRIVLIDAEHGTELWPRYYDIAHFYHRTYTTAGFPKLAKKYLRIVKKFLSKDKLSTFDKEFKSILATRIIGGFWEIKTSKKHIDDKYHQMLKKDFLKNNLY